MEKDSESLIMKNDIKKIKRKYKDNIFSKKLKGYLTKNIMNYLNIQSICEFRKTCIYIYNNHIEYKNIKIKKLQEEGQNSLFQINSNLDFNKKGFCFSCKIPYSYSSANLTKAIIISNNFFDRNKEKLEIINKYNKTKEINLKNKFKYIDKQHNTTIIELGEEKNDLYYFFSLKDDIFKNDVENKEKMIYILYYSENKKINISFGQLKETEDKKNLCF